MISTRRTQRGATQSLVVGSPERTACIDSPVSLPNTGVQLRSLRSGRVLVYRQELVMSLNRTMYSKQPELELRELIPGYWRKVRASYYQSCKLRSFKRWWFPTGAALKNTVPRVGHIFLYGSAPLPILQFEHLDQTPVI